MTNPRYSVIIPAHNEEARIETTLADYAGVFYDSEIIVVLNGCTDGTEACVRGVRARYPNVEYVEIQHAVGKGGAVRAGFLVARSSIIGFADADGATPAAEMRRLFERLGTFDGVIASRWMKESRVTKAQPFRRRVASRVFNAFARLFFGLKFRDTQCGAKVFRADALQKVIRNVETSNMAFDVDLLFAMKNAGLNVSEEPTEWQDVSGTSVHLAYASMRMFSALVRLRLRYSALRLLLPAFDRIFPTRPMRLHHGFSILILNWRDPSHPQAGGAETYLFEMAKRWAMWGNRVEWLTAGYKGCAPEDDMNGVRIKRVGNAATVYAAVPWTYLRQYRDRFDVVIDAENGIPFFSPLFSMKAKLCLIFHVHKRVFEQQLPRWISWFFVWLETKVMPYVYRGSRFVTISNTSKEEMLELGFSREPIEIVHSGVDEACVPGIKSQVPLISYVGRLKRYKRIDDLVRAFSQVRAQMPDARLVLAGSGDQEPVLRALVAELGLNDSVDILGYVDDATKVRVLQQSWLFVTPSSMEGWGIAAIEANACGTPALAYDVPGLREAIVTGVSGLIVPDGSDLVRPMLDVLGDAQLRATLEAGAIQRARQFSWTAAAEQFLDIIMRHVAGDCFSLVHIKDHWRVVAGTGIGSELDFSADVPLMLRGEPTPVLASQHAG